MPPLLVGLAMGTAAMYFFDPDRGRRRRALVRDKAVGATNCARDFVDDGVRDLKSRGAAAMSRVRSISGQREATSDRTLIERVRAVMGHYAGHPGAIDVYAADGRVTLNGSILSHEHRDLLDAVGAIPGVKNVVDQLGVYETALGISELQAGRAPQRHSGVSPRGWSPGAQLLTSAAVGLYLMRHSRTLRRLVYVAATGAALARLAPAEQVKHLTGSSRPAATGEARSPRMTADEVA